MSGLLIGILNMSLSASFIALIVILIRPALRKAPKIYSYALWAVVFFRLVCPFSIQLPMSAVPVQPQTIPHDIIFSQNPSIQSGVPAVDHAVNTAIEKSLPPVSPINSANPVQIALEIGSYLWLAGIFALLLYGLISYLRLKKRVMTAILVSNNVYETDLIKTPFVLGFLHPRIYIPTGLGEKELEYVIAHERTHIRRLDYLIKPLAFLITCAHWFNPIVWVSYALMARDMELSADERVMKRYDSDIRGDYSHSLLALSAKKSGLPSPLAFGETGVKARVKNVLHYKKPTFWIRAAATVAVVAISIFLLASRPMEPTLENPSNQGTRPNSLPESASGLSETAYATDYDRVKITFHSENKGFKTADEFETTDTKIVAYIDTTLRTSRTSAQEDDLENNHTNQYTIKLSNEIGGYSCGLYYDTLYDKAYIVKDGGLYETGTDFARYIDSFLENANITVHIDDPDAAALFHAYGWTLDYQLGGINYGLNKIKVLSEFDPGTYYFAYNNELSKDIGLDMNRYATANIDVEIYRIHEPMPQEFHPIENCRGIVVKNGGKIIGAFISAGRHSTFNACSLKGNSFEKVTGQTLYEWLADRIERDSVEKRLSKLQPEQVIEKYFAALDRKDTKTAQYCISKKTLLENLTINIPNDALFNERIGLPLTDANIGTKSSFDNPKFAKILKTERIKEEPDKKTKVFRVTVDLRYNEAWDGINGEQYWDCGMVYESPQTGWKIEWFGH
ncbi:M56 family metallopeptidase [Desulfotomaculum sp. 1211_IL3151]|uniref:M56 family metallopeptidase n=1 Tax=Desulfotomaculum sp. 1211_IL3151 TaxID=3084055 RepID=UPI002FDA95D4